MALSKGMYPLQAVLGAVKPVVIVGSFVGADGSVTAGTSRGHGYTITRAGEGVYTVTLDEPINRAVAFGAFVGHGTAMAVCMEEDSSTAFTIRTFIPSTDAADDVVGRCSFFIVTDESSSYVR